MNVYVYAFNLYYGFGGAPCRDVDVHRASTARREALA
jgi:hypothetical protein